MAALSSIWYVRSSRPLRWLSRKMWRPGLPATQVMPVTTVSTSPAKRSKDEVTYPAGPVLKFAKLSDQAYTPTRGSTRAAGYDLYSAYDYVIPALDKMVVKTDIQISVPTGCYGRVAGVIDEDYRGNVGVVLFNFGKEAFEVKKGDRVAQLICERILYPELEEVQALDDTERGAGGFGSTGQN
uniref:Deoxyuridine 5'-triphosphate nucleotidohydrolase n=1 Tax=Xenopus tropicalis TaxID=8364 RepID=A0A6I8RCA4_XENTR